MYKTKEMARKEREAAKRVEDKAKLDPYRNVRLTPHETDAQQGIAQMRERDPKAYYGK